MISMENFLHVWNNIRWLPEEPTRFYRPAVQQIRVIYPSLTNFARDFS